MRFDARRLRKELAAVAKDGETTGISCVTASGVSAGDATAANLAELRGSIRGPSNSPFENGVFRVEIKIPNDYPFCPPKMGFD